MVSGGDISGFQEIGVQIRMGCDVQILKIPMSGQQMFMQEICEARQEQFDLSFRVVEG